MAKQLTGALIALLAIGLLLAALLLRAGPPSPRPPAPPPSSPEPRDPVIPEPPPRTQPPPPRDRAKLLAWLESVGRASVLRDKRLPQLLANEPDALRAETEWLLAQLKGPTFIAVGACLAVARLHLHGAVGALDDVLKSTAAVFVKDAAVDALAALPGEASLSILLGVLKGPLDASIRAHAATALGVGAFEGPEVYRALASAFMNDSVSTVRKAAAGAMARLNAQDAVRLFLEKLWFERDPAVALQVAVLAWQHGGEKALKHLQKAVESNAVAKGAILEAIKRESGARYDHPYDPYFFMPGGNVVPFDVSKNLRIGITADLGAGSTLRDIVLPLFGAAPLDRYRDFFYLRVAGEFAQDIADGVPSPRAYDWRGEPMAGGLPRGDLDGTVFLAFRDASTFAPGILGITEGSKALVTTVSLMHEFGHAFARLADEYDSPLASPGPAENLAPRRPPGDPAWKPLADRGFVPTSPFPRVELKDGVDLGAWSVPSQDCHMSNRATDSRWCPVCQLEIIARIGELSGVAVPW